MGEYLLPIMFNEHRMNLRQSMTLFPEIFDEASLLHGYEYGKPTQNV
jgi:hypothetical protein